MIRLTKEKKRKILVAAGVVQLLIAVAALAYYRYLTTDAERPKSVGLVVNEAIAKQQRTKARAEDQSLLEGALIQPAAFQQPKAAPTTYKLQRFEGHLEFINNVPASKARINIKIYLPNGFTVEPETDDRGWFSFETDQRGKCSLFASSGGRLHGGKDIQLVDGRQILVAFR
jgi:hypothetical protein